MSYAKCAWTGKEQRPLPVKGNPVRFDPSELYLSKQVTLATQSLKAINVRCGTGGGSLLYERPHKLAKRGLGLHNALASVKARRDFRLHLTNISGRPVNLPKDFAAELAIPYDGPVHEASLVDLSLASEGADPVATSVPDRRATSSEAPPAESKDLKGQAGNPSRLVERTHTGP